MDILQYPLFVQFLGRSFLLVFNIHAIYRLAIALSHHKRAGTYLLLLSACQFHWPFYASRMLPNVFAMGLCTHAMACWVTRHVNLAVVLLVTTTVVFRCDCLLLLGPTGLIMLVYRHLTLRQALITGTISVCLAITVSVIVDSWFWQQWWIWPEGVVFYYNAILGKSSDWGVTAWHWYATSALPKTLLLTAVSLPVGLVRFSWNKHISLAVDWAVVPYAVPALAFIALYSCLGHKEVRFLFPVLPIFNYVSAVGISKIHAAAWDVSKSKRAAMMARLVHLGLTGCLLLSFAIRTAFLSVSHFNYPGGVALESLKQYVHGSDAQICIDVASAMSGVSLFGQKELEIDNAFYVLTFVKEGFEQENKMSTVEDCTFLLTNDLDAFAENTFEVIKEVRAEPYLDWRNMRIASKGTTFVLQRKPRVESAA